MRDHFSGDNIDVRLDKKCGPYIMIEPAKIGRVQELLRRNGIRFRLVDETHACKGTPEAAVIEFGREADVATIQRMLDSVQ